MVVQLSGPAFSGPVFQCPRGRTQRPRLDVGVLSMRDWGGKRNKGEERRMANGEPRTEDRSTSFSTWRLLTEHVNDCATYMHRCSPLTGDDRPKGQHPAHAQLATAADAADWSVRLDAASARTRTHHPLMILTTCMQNFVHHFKLFSGWQTHFGAIWKYFCLILLTDTKEQTSLLGICLQCLTIYCINSIICSLFYFYF